MNFAITQIIDALSCIARAENALPHLFTVDDLAQVKVYLKDVRWGDNSKAPPEVEKM